MQSNASLSKTAKIGTAGDRRTLELPPSLDAPSERIRGQASKHSRRGKAVRVAQRKGPETSRSLKKKRGRQGQGRIGGEVGGRQEGTYQLGRPRSRESALPGQKLPRCKPWRSKLPPCQGSQHDHIYEGEKMCFQGLSPHVRGPPPRTRATTARDTKPCRQPENSQKVEEREDDCRLAGGPKPSSPSDSGGDGP